jgi:hypothetical protein
MAQVLGSNFKSSGVQVKFLALPMSFNLGVPKACKVTSVVVLPKKKKKRRKRKLLARLPEKLPNWVRVSFSFFLSFFPDSVNYYCAPPMGFLFSFPKPMFFFFGGVSIL